ncbi:MAG: cupin domain-containing protein [Blastocatellia bacterium]
MTKDTHTDLLAAIRSAQAVLPCRDLAEALELLTGRLGFRVEMIVPADSPSVAVVSGHGVTLRLEASADAPATRLRLLCDLSSLPAGETREFILPGGMRVELADVRSGVILPEGAPEFVVSRLATENAWGAGRAGMQYRDLIPGRFGGRFIASHIRIPGGGETPDYVHFHKVRFQMIFCRAGWARVVYEDQGPSFVLRAGDCVLQPPEIRHRVLETSAGLEVIEIGSPAVHETHADHNLRLPTGRALPERLYGGQRFVRHRASGAQWAPWRMDGLEARDTGIAAATGGLAGARVVRAAEALAPTGGALRSHAGEFLFLFVLQGEIELSGLEQADHRLLAGDSCVIPAGREFSLRPGVDLEMLEVTLPAELPLRPAAARSSTMVLPLV